MDISVLRTFLFVVEEGSFAAAARRMGISRSLCSKNVADLEADLGARLLTRTTRKVTLTAIGQDFHPRLKDSLERLDAAKEAVRTALDTPTGELKIGSPILYTLKVFQPQLLTFMERFPDIRLQIVLDDGASDLVGEGFDAVIRIGNLKDSTLHARRLQSMGILAVASPDYLAQRGFPQKPSDLTDHECLHYTNLSSGNSWPFRHQGETVWHRIRPAFSTNNTELLHAMALSGRGIALLPEFSVRDEIAQGKLVSLMTDYSLPDVPVNLVYPSNKLVSGAMRSFLDFAAGLRLS